MLIGSIVGWEPGQDDLFNPKSHRNRDDCLEPFRALRDRALANGIELHTADVVFEKGLEPDFSIHVESDVNKIVETFPEYLILFETPLTVPLNGDFKYLNHFKGVFTWDLNLLEGKGANYLYKSIPRGRLIEFRTPNPSPEKLNEHSLLPSYYERTIFCCLIASNRHANLQDSRELYSERVKAIRWFEKKIPKNFHLYGNGWKVPEKRFGSLGRLRYRLEKVIPFLMRRPVFPSYQGSVEAKQSVLLNSKFCICYENARDIRGYTTEKIFDCLFAGCIPIYWGDPEIERWLPKECFIDFRKFTSYDDLYSHLVKISPARYLELQAAGQNFLKSKRFYIHSSQNFAETIVSRICADFDNQRKTMEV